MHDLSNVPQSRMSRINDTSKQVRSTERLQQESPLPLLFSPAVSPLLVSSSSKNSSKTTRVFTRNTKSRRKMNNNLPDPIMPFFSPKACIRPGAGRAIIFDHSFTRCLTWRCQARAGSTRLYNSLEALIQRGLLDFWQAQ